MIITYIILFVIGFACKNHPKKDDVTNTTIEQNDKNQIINRMYDFLSPEVIVLDKRLIEISGLAYDSSKDVFLTHDDEKGHIFEIDKSNGSILHDYKFGKKGDYESIEFVNGKIVIAESNGDLHFFDLVTNKTKTINTKLSSKNDVEGMCLSSNSNDQLLLACKGKAINESANDKSKLVYAFNIKSGELSEKAFLKINHNDIERAVKSKYAHKPSSKLKELISRSKEFSPSGIAIQPESKDYYIISARGSTLVIVGHNKVLLDVVFLDDRINKQPEGICFDREENLFISTEGHGLSAKIFKFRKH